MVPEHNFADLLYKSHPQTITVQAGEDGVQSVSRRRVQQRLAKSTSNETTGLRAGIGFLVTLSVCIIT